METEKNEMYFELSRKIRECADEIRELKVDDERKKDSLVINKSQDVDEKKRRIDEKILTIIGQMYKGVLVDGELSIRNDGKVYEYRCQYKPSCSNVLETIKKHLTEVEQKIGKNNVAMVNYLIELFYSFKKLELESESIDIKEELIIEPLTLAVVRDAYRDSEIYLATISKIKVDKNGIHFEHKDRDAYVSGYEEIIKDKFKDKIKEMAKKVLDGYIDIDKRMEEKLNEIEVKGAKYFIASTFECQ